MKLKKWIPVLCFGLLMAGLGSSDALRGIFAPVFQERYGLSESQLSMMVTVSYIGNLLFLSTGGKLLDTFSKKRVAMAVVLMWLGAAALNLLTDNYICIMAAMFFSLGASTLLNTTVNILTPAICAGYAGLMVNVFFFIQGIGTSGSQLLLGKYGFHYNGWRWINLILLAVGILVLLLLSVIRIPEQRQDTGEAGGSGEVREPGKQVFWIFTVMMGCYFIGEHGIMNWLMSYCLSALSMDPSQASVSLSLFWGGMTAGRLIFAPAVQRLGAVRSLKIFGGMGTVMFGAGCILGSRGVIILGASGCVISIVYPTMVLLIQQIYPAGSAATRTGAIISIATLADIVFNMLFGMAAGQWGYRISFMVLPAAMVMFYLLYLKLTGILAKTGAGCL